MVKNVVMHGDGEALALCEKEDREGLKYYFILRLMFAYLGKDEVCYLEHIGSDHTMFTLDINATQVVIEKFREVIENESAKAEDLMPFFNEVANIVQM